MIPLHYSSSLSSRQHDARAAAPCHQNVTVSTSQQLLSSCIRREFCLFSHLCNMVRRARLTHRHQNGHCSESGSLGYKSFLPHRTGSWACGFSLTETRSHKKSQWNNLQLHDQYQLSAIRLIWSTTSHQKSNLDRNKQNTSPSRPLMSQL